MEELIKYLQEQIAINDEDSEDEDNDYALGKWAAFMQVLEKVNEIRGTETIKDSHAK